MVRVNSKILARNIVAHEHGLVKEPFPRAHSNNEERL
jgi:hypothetical protein